MARVSLLQVYKAEEMRYLFVFLGCVLANAMLGQNGTITGTVTEHDNSDAPAFGALVRVDSTKLGAPCDFDGKYKISVPAGTYNITCQYTGYIPATAQKIVVSAGKTTVVDFPLTDHLEIMAGDSGGIVTIVETRITGTTGTMLKDIKEGNVATDGQTKQEIKATPVPDAAGVAKRIPGVTIVDNRFIIVRGLSERYNAVMLNGVLAPSVESDVKAFSFNLIPATMIDRFMVYKSASADMPGEFAGGVVKLTTTEIPDQTSLTFNYQFGYRNGTTFKPFTINTPQKGDVLGMGLGARELPGGFVGNIRDITDPDQLQQAGQSLGNPWSLTDGTALPDQRFNLTYSYRLSKPTYQFGNITGINYSNTNSYWNIRRMDFYTYDPNTGIADTLIDYDDKNYVNNVRLAFVQNNALRYGKAGQHRLTFKNLFNQLGDNETSLRTGNNYEDGEERHEYSFHYMQRRIYTGQLGGQNEFNDGKNKLDYALAYSSGTRNDPDWKRARYSRPFGSLPDDPYYLYVPAQAVPFFLSRLHVSMREHAIAGAVNYEHKITIGESKEEKKDGYTFTVKVGTYVESKEREFGVRNIGYKYGNVAIYQHPEILSAPIDSIFIPENINHDSGFAIDEDTKKADVYIATNQMMAGYALAVFPIGKFKGQHDEMNHERIRMSMGVRAEKNVQQLNSNRINGDTVIVNNDELRILPSVNIAFNLTDRMLIRTAYGKTVNRPEFREIAPLYFFDFINNSINAGNDSLKTATIDNLDLRWEFYPRNGENITIGAFYKRFVNPIEMYFVAGIGGSGVRSFTWANAVEATSYGVEIEIRKKLDSVDVPVIRNLSVVANAAYIFSEITLTDQQIVGQDTKRPMMGQSPWIANLGLYYQNDSIGFQFNVMYNIIGPRVVVAGILDVPEIYEMPRHQVDLSIVKTLGKRKNIDLRLNVIDLLNQENLLLQDKSGDGQLDRIADNRMASFKRGTYATIGITMRLLEPKQK
jgi:TonB-dependent receptor